MKDNLEDFIRQHRDAFDHRQPPRRIWSRIETMLGLKQPRIQPVVLWRAAAIFFMALSAYLLIPQEPSRSEQAVALREFSDVESFYFQQITHKEQLIEQFPGTDAMNGFTHDFQQLDAMYLVLKEEMKSSPSQKVRDAMILNLLVRIDLLNQHLHRLEQERARERAAAGESGKSI